MAIGIGDLDIAVSESGIEDYMDALKLDIDRICDGLDEERKKIDEKLDAIWVGESKDVFQKNLKKEVKKLKNDLDDEYKDLRNRLRDLANFYFDVDKNMMK